MRTLPFSFILVLAAACSTPGTYSPKNVSGNTALLDDCTESVSAYLGWDVPSVPTKTRTDLVAAASAWAEVNGYAPCDYRMCATIKDYSAKSATIYVSHDVAEPTETKPTDIEGVEEIIIRIGPEAEVTFDLPSFNVSKYGYWHSGCGKTIAHPAPQE